VSKILIDGVICGSPGGAGSSQDDWSLVIFLHPWRHPDGHLERRWIRVEHQVGSYAAVGRAIAQFDEKMFVRVTAELVLAPEGRGGWWGLKGVTSLEKTNGDLALQQAAREAAKPVVVTDVTLGRFELDRGLSRLVGKRSISGHRYELSIEAGLEETPEADVGAMRSRVTAFEQQLASITAAISNEMLALYNDTWRRFGFRLTRDRFVRRLRLESAHVAERRTTLYVDAGRLFGSHTIEVRIGPQGEIREVMLVG